MNCLHFFIATAPKIQTKPNFNSCVKCLKSKKKGYKISLHKFPKDPVRREVWLRNCKFAEKEIEHNRLLCSSHFEKDSIVLHGKRRVLKKSAVPVIFKKKQKIEKNKKESQRSKSLQKPVDLPAVTKSNCKVYFIPAVTIILVKPIVIKPVPAATHTQQDTQASGPSETILQIKVEELENPAADVIPKWVLGQFTEQLSGYSLDPEKNDGTNDVPIFPENF